MSPKADAQALHLSLLELKMRYMPKHTLAKITKRSREKRRIFRAALAPQAIELSRKRTGN